MTSWFCEGTPPPGGAERRRDTRVLIYLSVSGLKPPTHDEGGVRGALTASEAAECVRFGRGVGRNTECRWHLWSPDRREPLNIPLISPSSQETGRLWADPPHPHPNRGLPYSLNDTNHSATKRDSISSGVMCGGCSLQKAPGARTWTTRGFTPPPLDSWAAGDVWLHWAHLKQIQQICCMWLSRNKISDKIQFVEHVSTFGMINFT